MDITDRPIQGALFLIMLFSSCEIDLTAEREDQIVTEKKMQAIFFLS